ncbi:hypothetical protein BCY91_14025 [Pelobium manganitolerans]|uniref:Uncharacterized protein n=1 Tax=Pelobium manganitolerans TaxID=1842495 RepID=A0A419S9U4_9SPHI|nr:hypothetical protein BCY91_14025 [Pelobium manganitolerans]
MANNYVFADRHVKCPYCGITNRFYKIEAKTGRDHQFINCDEEEGGCGRKFVLQTDLSVKLELSAYIIKSEE